MPQKSSVKQSSMIPIGLSLLLVPVVVSAAFLKSLFFALVLIATTIAALKAIQNSIRKNKRLALMAKVSDIINGKLDRLTRRRAQLVQADAYGRVLTGRWDKEIDYFIDNHLLCKFIHTDQQLLQRIRGEIVSVITERTRPNPRPQP